MAPMAPPGSVTGHILEQSFATLIMILKGLMTRDIHTLILRLI